jgi:hypothetical protein
LQTVEQQFNPALAIASAVICHFMKNHILVIILIILTFQSYSQNDMDRNCIKQIRNFSADLHFPKYTGLISVSKDTIKYDSSIIIIWDTAPEIIKIFELGLVFPDLIYGASTTGDKYEFRKTFSLDTLTISNVSELHFPNQRHDTKSFSFLLWEKNLANPFYYLFELTNETADSKTAIKIFIEKSEVTAFGFCSILL